MKKLTRSCAFWFVVLSVAAILLHLFGKDPRAVALIAANPALSVLSDIPKAKLFMDSGPHVKYALGTFSACWYLLSVFTAYLYGAVIDWIRAAASRRSGGKRRK